MWDEWDKILKTNNGFDWKWCNSIWSIFKHSAAPFCITFKEQFRLAGNKLVSPQIGYLLPVAPEASELIHNDIFHDGILEGWELTFKLNTKKWGYHQCSYIALGKTSVEFIWSECCGLMWGGDNIGCFPQMSSYWCHYHKNNKCLLPEMTRSFFWDLQKTRFVIPRKWDNSTCYNEKTKGCSILKLKAWCWRDQQWHASMHA